MKDALLFNETFDSSSLPSNGDADLSASDTRVQRTNHQLQQLTQMNRDSRRYDRLASSALEPDSLSLASADKLKRLTLLC